MKHTKNDLHVLTKGSCAVIVAHPDDETLWAGGTILMRPESEWTIVTLCRKSDSDRAPRFYRVMERLCATGVMGDVDDGPEQTPLNGRKVQAAILELLPSNSFDVILTHGLHGEYTRHRRHEETAKAVRTLWESKELCANELWMFAYEDGGGNYLPKAIDDADVKMKLPDEIWREKYNIVTNVYGFGPESFEAKTTPREEAFYCIKSV